MKLFFIPFLLISSVAFAAIYEKTGGVIYRKEVFTIADLEGQVAELNETIATYDARIADLQARRSVFVAHKIEIIAAILNLR